MRARSQRRYSVDEYFAVEETSRVKNEYYDGEIFAMAGASLAHNRIVANLLALLRPGLLPRGCEAFGSDLRVGTPGGFFAYPDVSIVCGEPALLQRRPDTLTNPIVLVEVLSDATRDYDCGDKFRLYQDITTLREYVLVEQNAPKVSAFNIAKGQWTPSLCDHIDAHVALRSLEITIALSDIYRLVFS
jgi:Uma2 family endonuclease